MNRKLISFVLIFIVLLILPFFYRQMVYGSGNYVAPEIPRVNSEQIEVQLSEYSSFTDKPLNGQGRVVIDLSHQNSVERSQLAPLRDRLSVRGVTVDFFTGDGNKTLKKALRSATALLVLAPTTPYQVEERELIQKFVSDGGQLVLGADPVLPLENNQGLGEFLAALFPNSGYPAINSLAAEFETIYFNDYLYNLENNSGDYRHIELTELDRQHPLTKGLNDLVFVISHSLHGEGLSLIGGNDNTLSSLRPGETDLVAGSLSTNGQVLALGDVTFLTPPYYTMGDNDQFLSRLADWLAVDNRTRTMEDFPYFFTRSVDVIQINKDVIDNKLITQMRGLQDAFKNNNVLINLRDKPNPKNDTLYVGSFDDVHLVQDLLLMANVTIDNGKSDTSQSTPQDNESSPISPTESISDTEQSSDKDEDKSQNAVAPQQSELETIVIEGLGTISVEETTVFVMDDSDEESFKLITLAKNVETALNALTDLNDGNLANCILAESVTVCADNQFLAITNEETADTNGETEQEEGGNASSTALKGDIFILANDDGAKGSQTNVEVLQELLEANYDINIWSVKEQGVPTANDVKGYKMYLIDSGDYVADSKELEILSAFTQVEGGMMFIGSQAIQLPTEKQLPLDKVEVLDDKHPIVEGWQKGGKIELAPSESGVPPLLLPALLEKESTKDISILLTRSVEGEETGQPVMVAFDKGLFGKRGVMASFMLSQLPKSEQDKLINSAVQWIMEE